jgi:hypothetical protein
MGTRILLLTAALAGLLAGPAAPAVQAQDGFLFRQPQGQLTVRAGPMVPRAQSDIFDFLTTELTLERGDFLAPAFSAELALLAHRHLDVAVGFGWATSSSSSEYADFLGDDGLPIQQTTWLRMTPVTLSLRVLPLARGRALSELAWLPARTTPYMGGGGGVTWYRLRQEGEFIQAVTNAIIVDEYVSSGQGLTAHALAGVDHWITSRIGANIEGRYTWGSAGLEGSFRTYDSLDLTGFQVGLGISFRW